MEGGRRRVYRARSGFDDGQHWHGFEMLEDEQTHQGRLQELVRSYLLPQVRVVQWAVSSGRLGDGGE